MTVSLAQAQTFFLALTRILAMLIHVPVLGGRAIPNQVKVGLGLLLTMILIPWQSLSPEAPPLALFPFTIAIGRELLIGTLAGFAAVLIFGALQISGNLMGLGSGFAAAQILNPALEESGSTFDQMFVMTALLIFLAINGHHAFLLGVKRTFDLLPLQSPLPEISLQRLLTLTSGMITAGVQMALPLLGTLLLTDLTLGLLARVAPQMHVFFLGISLKVGLGLLALTVALSFILPQLSDLLRSIGEHTLQLLGT